MQNNDSDDNDYQTRIAATWRRGLEAALETGKLLIEAKERLQPGTFHAMIRERLPFKPRTARRLMAIARHPILVF